MSYSKNPQNACGEYAAEASAAEAEAYGYIANSYESFQAYQYYFDICSDYGAGSMLGPVNIE